MGSEGEKAGDVRDENDTGGREGQRGVEVNGRALKRSMGRQSRRSTQDETTFPRRPEGAELVEMWGVVYGRSLSPVITYIL